MEIYVSVFTNNAIDDHSLVYADFTKRNIKVLSIYEPRNADYSKHDRTYVTYQITLHRSISRGFLHQWCVSKSFSLPERWVYEHGPSVFMHSYELQIDDSLVQMICCGFGSVVKIEYKNAPGHYHAKVTMSCAIIACALVQKKNGCIHHDKCIFINFNSQPFES
jgi:hypothetical protein